jgi:hypothetical protein
MKLPIPIFTLFLSFNEGNSAAFKTTQQSWYVSSMTRDEGCGSSSDDQLIFFAKGHA